MPGELMRGTITGNWVIVHVDSEIRMHVHFAESRNNTEEAMNFGIEGVDSLLAIDETVTVMEDTHLR